ncbi:multidrug efflux pump subunit AcrB [Fontibacillus solani]|uniref:Multidrug efflux pump subunit AcrB n=1 Tax=Fontibacillus solani TaxID=1572857 RepID=A0A7W3XRM2_9BACL|nr:multidrug efflux pump subunit AcrB [Fontibacillus solani]
MKQESIPNINVPYLSITAVYPGAAPEAVVQEVTKPLEQRLHNVNHVKTITSTSMENAASLFIEFDYETNLDNATAEVREALNDVTLPDDAQKPKIARFSINSMPVISLSLSDNKDGDLESLTRITENDIKASLEDVDGVASVQIAGQYVKEVQLKFDQAKLQQLGLSEDTVKSLVQASAVRAPLGLFEMEQSQKAVVVDGNITTIDDLKNLAIPVVPSRSSSGAPAGSSGMGAAGGINLSIPTVKLSDIASIEVSGEAESLSRTNGVESIGIQIIKSNDANTVDVVNQVKDEVDKLKEQYSNVDFTVLLDQGKPITDSVNTMLSKALFGALFAVLIILLFLRNIRSTIISIISIPLSLLIAIVALKQMDITLNMMTLGAMTVAIGRVVDDSIVVIENIYRRMSLTNEKLKGSKLIIEATREMFVPILSSTIVTIAVFLPLAFVSGMVGELFKPFALTMVFSLLASLLVAITLVPALAHTLFRKGLTKTHDHDENPKGIARAYQRALKWSLSHKLVTFGLAVVMLIGSLFLYPFIGVSFLPDQEDKYVMVTYSPTPGDRLEDVKDKMLKAEQFILDQPDVDRMQIPLGEPTLLASVLPTRRCSIFNTAKTLRSSTMSKKT